MKKETETDKIYRTYGGAILVMLSFIGLILYLSPYSNNEITFNITKEECWNITGEIGFDNFEEEEEKGFGFNENILSYKIKSYGIYKIDDLFCIDYLKQQGHKDFLLHSCRYYEEGIGLEIIGSELIDEGDYFSYGEKISYSIYPEKIEEIFLEEFTFNEKKVYLKDGKIINENTFYYIIADIIKNQTICEQVEVEDNVIDWCYSENSCGQIKIGDSSWGIKWLDENCKCLELICENGDYHALDDLCIGESGKRYKPNNCKKYKCGDYQVEVLK